MLNYVPRVPSSPSYLTCLRTLRVCVPYVLMYFTCLRAFVPSYVPFFFYVYLPFFFYVPNMPLFFYVPYVPLFFYIAYVPSLFYVP